MELSIPRVIWLRTWPFCRRKQKQGSRFQDQILQNPKSYNSGGRLTSRSESNQVINPRFFSPSFTTVTVSWLFLPSSSSLPQSAENRRPRHSTDSSWRVRVHLNLKDCVYVCALFPNDRWVWLTMCDKDVVQPLSHAGRRRKLPRRASSRVGRGKRRSRCWCSCWGATLPPSSASSAAHFSLACALEGVDELVCRS